MKQIQSSKVQSFMIDHGDLRDLIDIDVSLSALIRHRDMLHLTSLASIRSELLTERQTQGHLLEQRFGKQHPIHTSCIQKKRSYMSTSSQTKISSSTFTYQISIIPHRDD